MSWTWWMTVLVILAVLVLIGCIPVGVDAAYGEGGVLLSAKLGFLKLQLLPKKPKKEKPAKPPKPAKKPSPPPAHEPPATPAAQPEQKKFKIPGGFDGLLRLV